MGRIKNESRFLQKLYLTIMSPFGYVFMFDDPNAEKKTFGQYMIWILKEIWTNPDVNKFLNDVSEDGKGGDDET